MSDNALLQIDQLTVSYRGAERPAVSGATLTLRSGEVLAVIGESGSGKSTLSKAIIGLLPPSARVDSGKIVLDGHEITAMRERELVKLRGRLVGLVPQDPASSLDPVQPIGRQITEVFRLHPEAGSPLSRSELRDRALALLELVGIDHPERRLGQYPHELSGGMKQRVLIAIAFGLRPKLLIADEPTSALDVTVQQQVLEVFDRLTRQTGVAVLFVTHNLAVAADHAARAIVMQGGEVLESGAIDDLVERPQHSYTQMLIGSALRQSRSVPRTVAKTVKVDGVTKAVPREPLAAANTAEVRAFTSDTPHGAGEPRAATNDAGVNHGLTKAFPQGARAPLAAALGVEVEGLTKVFPHGPGSHFKAVDDVSFAVAAGSTFALVGESGSGKSTTARLILGLARPDAGRVRIGGKDVTRLAPAAQREVWRQIQLVHQNPQVALDPRLTIAEIVEEPLRAFGIGRRDERRRQVAALLDRVGLSGALAARKPRELSGGQQQRVAIARALAPRSRVVVLDEALSALDVATQGRILDLLAELQRELDLTYLFISHDLDLVRSLSDSVAVLRRGRLIETGPTAQVFAHPTDPYTRALLDATPGRRLHAQHGAAHA